MAKSKRALADDQSLLSFTLMRQQLLTNPPDVRIDGTVPFRLGWTIELPQQAGVYLLHDLRGVLYVGRTENLRRRFYEHYLKETNPLITLAISKPLGTQSFNWILAEYPDQKSLERQLIRAFKPVCNRIQFSKKN
jgi:hypothetical protein